MKKKSRLGRSWPADLVCGAVLIIGTVVMLLPFVWMLLSSFKLQTEIISIPPTFLPQAPTLIHYQAVFTRIPILRYYLNSLIVSGITTVSMVLTSAAMGYVLAKFEFRGRSLVFALVLSTMMLPLTIMMIPLFIEISYMGLIDSLGGIILPSLFSATGIFLMRQSMFSFPSEMREAAVIDGCGEFSILARIVLPLFKPAMASLAILVFMNTWDGYLWPLLVLHTRELFTLPLGLATLNFENVTDYGILMAGAAVSVIPVILVFLFMQRNFIEALTLSGVKA